MKHLLFYISHSEQNAALITLACISIVAVTALIISKTAYQKITVSKTRLAVKVLSAIGLVSLLVHLPTLVTHVFCVIWYLLLFLIFLLIIIISFLGSII